MAEQELKLHVPKHARAGVERDLARGATNQVPLRAMYFDTATRALVKAKIGLRLRREGRNWVQTLKMPGDHALARIELNHPRPGPILDLSVYVGTAAEQILANLSEPLSICYETDIKRTLRRIRTARGTVEVAYDLGWIRAGGLNLPVSEVEFELLSGNIAAIFYLGKRWQQAHGLLFDARSKAERGDRLALLAQRLKDSPDQSKAIAGFWSTRTIAPVLLKPEMTASEALAAVMTECIDQIARNAAILAEIDTANVCRAATPEHVHQMRVGIRRMRSAWSLFNGIASLPPLSLRTEIKQHFARLGGTRDDDVLRETLLPVLSASGQPPIVIASEQAEDHTAELCASRAFQSWLLDTIAWTLGVSIEDEKSKNAGAKNDNESAQNSTPPAEQEIHSHEVLAAQIIPLSAKPLTLAETMSLKLRKWHRQVVRDGLRFEQLEIETRHELRKRAKRLRYGLQFCETLLPINRLKHYRKQLSVVQDVLGEMNDLAVARDRFEALKATQPQAWFAVGWITSRLETLVHDASQAFKVLSQAERFWR